ncbi:MAG TPA: carboxypeptidase-like regulatory domain-containing protein [Bacteroidales bacterium]|nr:carboxypeptidase-like regulatory domain-containing protein [Bacteroidales bacterium]
MKRTINIIFILALFSLRVLGQDDVEKRYVEVSGLIIDIDNQPVYGVSVMSTALKHATISGVSGIYSITSTPGDTIFYRALGYKRYHTIIPESYTGRYATVDIRLEPDTINIEPVTILPWKTYSEFLSDITKERPVDPIEENMNRNMASIYVAMQSQTNLSITPEASFRYATQQNFNSIATRQQYPVNNLLNPFAWAKFISGVKNGMFKNQKYNKPSKSKIRKKKN